MRMDQLYQFIIISEAGSITAASKQLYISQSSLSSSIASMEKEIGRQIFQRSHNGISLTPYGLKFYKAAREILDTYENVINLPMELNEEQLHISSQFLLYASSIFTNIISENKKVISSFKFTEKTTSGVIKDVINRTSEVGLIVTRSELHNHYKQIAKNQNLEYNVINSDECICLVGRGNPLYYSDDEDITMQQLQGFPMIKYEIDANSVESNKEFDMNFSFPHSGVLVISDTGSLQNILAKTNGFFIGIHNEKAYSTTDFYDNIRVIKLRDKSFTYDTAWLKKKDHSLSPLAKDFLKRIYLAVGASPINLSFNL
ncbi:MAG: LysR family transcriptional regulator [Synergistaceae bacterium]|nr:LysR family transcriptional regulator [Synergistaceae bacterium]